MDKLSGDSADGIGDEVKVEKSTDFMYSNGLHGLSLRKFKQLITMTVFEDKNYQVFYTEGGNFVYTKQDEKVYELTIGGWTRMVMKLESFFKDLTINYAGT